jgi:nucleotide-binding universal stress UspA family protein
MIQRILVSVDGSLLAEQALSQAAAIAHAFDSEIHLLRVQEPQTGTGGFSDSVSWRLGRAEATSYLEGLAARLRGSGRKVETSLAEGRAADEILNAAHDLQADLIVLSTHGATGQSRFHLGSTAQKVVSQAGRSVLIVRAAEGRGAEPAEALNRRILVPLDGSQRAQWALGLSSSIARVLDSELLLVHVVHTPELQGQAPVRSEERELARLVAARDRELAEEHLGQMKSVLAGSSLVVRTLLVDSPNVAETLCQIARDERVSLIVMSAHGSSGAAPWPYGSVADRLIAHGTTPLLVFQDLPAQGAGSGEAAPELRSVALSSS